MDNGNAIAQEDIDMAVQRNATSKISCFDDLPHVSTYGFRGEALNSITNISSLTISTKTAYESVARVYKIENGVPVRYVSLNYRMPSRQMNPGSIFLVEDIFASIPVRLQQLKKDWPKHIKKIRQIVKR